MIYNTSSHKLIYIFAINDEGHRGLLKIGDATIKTTKTLDELQPNCPDLMKAADQGRIKDYTFNAGIKIDLLWAQVAVRRRTDILDGEKITVLEYFRDHDVHNVLKNSGIKVSFPNGIKNREWFECNLETAKNAINAAINFREFLNENEKAIATEKTITLREEQMDAVDKTLKAYKRYDKMLWNAKMRFGKTLTAYELIRTGKYQKTLVVTHRPVVEHGWENDHRKLFGSKSSHVFMKKQNLVYSEDYFDASSDIKNDVALRNARARGDSFTYFASMQDLRGSKRAGGKFRKNNAVFDMDWDLVIYDEAHEGTQTDLGQHVQELLESPKNGRKPKVLELSGTPYNILENYEDEENVFVWDYVKEQEAKRTWEYKHPGEPNPYADMPQMNIFTFDMSKALSSSYRYETESSAFNFREFFRIYTGDPSRDFGQIPQGYSVGDFVHEDDVKEFLNIITTDSPETKYPFATDEYRREFKHTFWIVPGVAAARALSKLLKYHPVFMHYKVANVAGDGDMEMPYDDAYNAVRKTIAENPYTITLSCGKLTTGVTVPEWTAVMMLTGSATTEAKGYMQTIFRVQSAGSIDGQQKENCYVFDFAPDRSLRVISEAHRLSRQGQNTDEKYRELLGKFLNYCPIYAIEGVTMREYNVPTLMRQIKRISLDKAIKSGFEDDSLYKVDAGIVMEDSDREFFEALKNRLTGHKKSTVSNKVKLAENGMSQAEYARARQAERKPKKELTPEEQAALDKLKEQRKQRQTFLALLRNISIRLPLLIFGAHVPLTENITMEDFVNIVDDESWREFLPPDVSKDLFRRSIKYFDEDVLIGAGLRIRRLVKQADEYPPTERIRRITELFNHFRNPDKETVLTPWRVVNMHMSDCLGGYCFLNEQFDSNEPLDEPRFVDRGQVTADLFETDSAKILEINSKSGLYPLYAAYSIYRHMLPKREEDMPISDLYDIWNKVLENNIYVLCKTRMAQDITRRTLRGFTQAKTNTHYQPHLLERMKTDMDWVVKKIKNPAVWGKGGNSMKFDAIVGNPPYQENLGQTESQTQSNTMWVYPYFQILGDRLDSRTCLIYPFGGWFDDPSSLGGLGNTILKDGHTVSIYAYEGTSDKRAWYRNDKQPQPIFENSANLSAGVSIVHRDRLNHEAFVFSNRVYTDESVSINIDDVDFLTPNPLFIGINKKLGDKKISSIIKKGIFGIESNFVELNPGKVSFNKNDWNEPILLRTNDKSGSAGRAKNYWTDITNIPKGSEYFDYFKVLMTSAYPKKSLTSGELTITNIKKRVDELVEFLPERSAFGRCRMALFMSRNKQECDNYLKYMHTNFFAGLILQEPNRSSTIGDIVPLQDFSENSDIDWSKPISEIDKQLYAKYGLNKEEIAFIESMVKPME